MDVADINLDGGSVSAMTDVKKASRMARLFCFREGVALPSQLKHRKVPTQIIRVPQTLDLNAADY